MDAGGLSREWMDLLIRNVFALDNSTSKNEEDDKNADNDKRKKTGMQQRGSMTENEVREEEEERFVMRIDHANTQQQHDNIHYYHDISLSPDTFGYMFM